MPVTIRDVAREAGVSPSTVSKVMNNWPTISEQTCRHVRETMQRLGYVPNTRAASFARKATRNLAFLAYLRKGEAFHNPHMFETLCGAHHAVSKKGYSLSLMNISEEKEAGEVAQAIIANQGFDGMIIHGSAISSTVARLLVTSQFPHIVIAKPRFESQICWLDTNHTLSGSIAANHLLDSGCNTIAFVGGQKADRISLLRLQGVTSSIRERGLRLPDAYIRFTDSGVEQSYHAAMELLQAEKRPDAIVCANNTIAIGVLKAIREKSLLMPDEIALIAFDDFPFSRMMDPMPTVVNIDAFDLGIQAGSFLVKKIKNPALQIQSYSTLPDLVQRSTTRTTENAVIR